MKDSWCLDQVGIRTLFFVSLFTVSSFLYSTKANGQPTADFLLNSEYCLSENIFIENTSDVSSTQFSWFFCPSHIGNEEAIIENSTNSSFGRSNATAIAADTSVVVLYANASLRKASYADNLLNGFVSITPISGSSGSFSGQSDFAIIKDEGEWYGFTPNNSVIGVSRSFFGNEIGDALESFDFIDGISPITLARSIEIIKSDDNSIRYIVAGKSSGGELVFVEFANGFGEPATSTFSHNVTGASDILGISHRQVNGGWELFVISNTGNRLFQVSLDQNFENPLSSNLLISGYIPVQPGEIELSEDNGIENLILLESDGNLEILEFVNSSWSFKRTITTSQVGFSTLNAVSQGLTTVLIGSSTGGSFGGLNRIGFTSSCSAVPQVSGDKNALVNYTLSGSESITLVSFDDEKLSDRKTLTTSLNTNQAPEVSFTDNGNECEDVEMIFSSVFVPQAMRPAPTYSWAVDEVELVGPGSDEEDLNFTFDNSGDHSIRLMVDDGLCQNVAIDTVTIYIALTTDIVDFTISTPPFCSNSDITFINSANEADYDGATLSYNWNYNDESSSSERNGLVAFTDVGDKDITLTMSIPGCEASSTQTINVLEGPTPDFSFVNQCFGEVAQFTNMSSGVNLQTPTWTFGDGNLAALDNPSNEYPSSGEYMVTLEVSNTDGCVSTIEREIQIFGEPNVSFTQSNSLCQNQVIDFNDESTSGDIFSNVDFWSWDFAGLGTSGLESPNFTFAESGLYEIQLTVRNEGGCENSETVNINVQPTPLAGINIIPGCINGVTVFEDASQTVPENQIDIWLWNVEDNNGAGRSINQFFDEAGVYEATLTVTGDNGCQSQTTDQVQIFSLPQAEFNVEDDCDNEQTRFTDASIIDDGAMAPSVVSWTWEFADDDTANGSEAFYDFSAADTYDVTLTVRDERNCEGSIVKPVIINSSPIASFNVSESFGAPPLTVDFTNTSGEGLTSLWTFGDTENSTMNTTNAQFIYQEFGDFTSNLTVTDENGCSGETSLRISAIDPVIDLRLTSISSEESNDKISFLLFVENIGNVDIPGFDIELSLDNGSRFFESYDQVLNKSQSVNVPLNITLSSDTRSELVCATLKLRGIEEEEEDISNNGGCVDFTEELNVLPAYPNPVNSDVMTISVILPSKSPVSWFLMDSSGKEVLVRTDNDADVGLNSYELNMSNFRAGVYYLKINSSGGASTQKIIRL